MATASPRAEQRAVGRLAALVGTIVNHLESADEPAAALGEQRRGAVAECTSALERYLEMQRDVVDFEDRATSAADDLRRLARLLTVVERPEVPMVMRQIRRVLGRLDVVH